MITPFSLRVSGDNRTSCAEFEFPDDWPVVDELLALMQGGGP